VGPHASVGDRHIDGMYSDDFAWVGLFFLLTYPSLPAIPDIATPAPGPSDVPIGSGSTTTLVPGAFAAMVVPDGVTVQLNGGVYDFSMIELGVASRLEALGPVEIHVAQT